MADFLFSLLLTFDATLRVATPLVFCAMAGLFSERSGVIDISLEGKMLAAAFGAASIAAVTGSAWLALGAGIAVSVALGLLHGFACITHRGDQVVSGVAINIMVRSEEHTSELQSLMRHSSAVFCLKNKTKNKKTTKS